MTASTPTLRALGDSALLIQFATTLSSQANQRAISLADRLAATRISGVVELVPSLVSVLVRYDPRATSFDQLAGEIRLSHNGKCAERTPTLHEIALKFDGEDLTAVAAFLNMTPSAFAAVHNATQLRVLATGFAPGFVYCGFHPENLRIARRTSVRPRVPTGTVIFAAGQTGIAATDIPTGWHVIGHTDFRNFDAAATSPTILRAGDLVQFKAMS